MEVEKIVILLLAIFGTLYAIYKFYQAYHIARYELERPSEYE